MLHAPREQDTISWGNVTLYVCPKMHSRLRVFRARNCKSGTVLEPRKPALHRRASNWFWQINRNTGLTGASSEIHLSQRGKVVFWLVPSKKKSLGNMIVKSKRIVTRMRSFEWTRIFAHSYNVKYYTRYYHKYICTYMGITYKVYNLYKHLNIYIYLYFYSYIWSCYYHVIISQFCRKRIY